MAAKSPDKNSRRMSTEKDDGNGQRTYQADEKKGKEKDGKAHKAYYFLLLHPTVYQFSSLMGETLFLHVNPVQ